MDTMDQIQNSMISINCRGLYARNALCLRSFHFNNSFIIRTKSPMVEGGPSDGAYPGGGRSSMELPVTPEPAPLLDGGLRLEVNWDRMYVELLPWQLLPPAVGTDEATAAKRSWSDVHVDR